MRGGSTQVAGLAHPLILPEVRYSLASLSPSPFPWGKHSVNSAPHSATAGSLTAYPGVRVWETLKGNSEVHIMTVLGRERRYSGTSRTQISAPYYLITILQSSPAGLLIGSRSWDCFLFLLCLPQVPSVFSEHSTTV